MRIGGPIEKEKERNIYYRTFHRRFESEEYHKCLWKYIETRASEDLEALYFNALPLIGMVIDKYYRGADFIDKFGIEELVAECSCALLKLLMAGTKTRYINPVSIYSKALKVCKKVARESLNPKYHVFEGLYLRDYVRSRSNPQDIEHAVFLDQLRNQLVKYVSEHIRFIGADREVCFTVLNRILTGKAISEIGIMKECDSWRAEFFINHVFVLCRSFLIKFRNKFDRIVELPPWARVVYTEVEWPDRERI